MATSEELYDQAVDCVAAGNIDEAIDKYRQAVALDPACADAWEGLSMALADRAEWEEAIAAALKVVELSPDEQLAYTNVSRIYQRAGKVSDAEAWAAKGRVLEWKQQLKEEKA
jgi:Flp pilus assembly protein TadD